MPRSIDLVVLDSGAMERRRRLRLLTTADLCRASGLSRRTVDRARMGGQVSLQSAQLIAAAMHTTVRALCQTTQTPSEAGGICEELYDKGE